MSKMSLEITLLLLVISAMKSKYGVLVRSTLYDMDLLNTSDRVGRIVGYHDITPIPLHTQKEYIFDHQDLNKYGKVFAWFGSAFLMGLAGDIKLEINNGIIKLELKNMYTNGVDGEYEDIIKLYYGVY